MKSDALQFMNIIVTRYWHDFILSYFVEQHFNN